MTIEAEIRLPDVAEPTDAEMPDSVSAASSAATKLELFVQRAAITSDSLRALSHEHRLMILCLLTGRERSVGELEQILKLPQPAVSQQLARLRLDDLVTSRRNGRTIFYTSDVAKLEAIYRNLGELLGYTSESAEVFARIDGEIAEVLRRLAPPEVNADDPAMLVQETEAPVQLSA